MPRRIIKIAEAAEEMLIDAARNGAPINGLTHTFYRYPARFSPVFVRACIKALSKPGDVIMDPFMGGGTTLVEALSLGRHASGADISALAAFITRVKTTLLSEGQLARVASWAARLPATINVRRKAPTSSKYAAEG